MPRPDWAPRADEANKFYQVFIDESSQTKFRYLVLGALCVPLSHGAVLEDDLVEARDHSTPLLTAEGQPGIMKWQKVSKFNLVSYVRFVDAYFGFARRRIQSSLKNVETHCLVVDTSKKTLKSTGGGDAEIGFNKEFYFLCVPVLGNRLKTALFHLYPDRRTTNHSLKEARQIMNAGAKKYGDKRPWPYRELRFEDPESKQALQLVDILIGSIAYKLNGHYDAPDANPAKKTLCDHIFERAHIKNPFVPTDYWRKALSITHRDNVPGYKRAPRPTSPNSVASVAE